LVVNDEYSLSIFSLEDRLLGEGVQEVQPAFPSIAEYLLFLGVLRGYELHEEYAFMLTQHSDFSFFEVLLVRVNDVQYSQHILLLSMGVHVEVAKVRQKGKQLLHSFSHHDHILSPA
jgi:hypothetical protein